MDVGVYSYPQGDPLLIDKIVNEFLSQGRFDKLRKECMSDADTKPAYQNLQQRVENTVSQFLKKQVWRPDLNKNQLRDSLRKHILESKFFDAGINRIVDQVVNPNLLATVFLPEVEEVVYNYLSIPRPADKNQKKGFSDEKLKPFGREFDQKTSQPQDKTATKRSEGDQRRENHIADEECKPKDAVSRKVELSNDPVKTEPEDTLEEKIKWELQDLSLEKIETPSEDSQESVGRLGVEALHISEPETAPPPDSDDSVPLEINEKSMSESRDSEDSIMNQMSPISQGRLTPELEEEKPEVKQEAKEEMREGEKKEEAKQEKKEEEKKPLTFIGRIPKIKREEPNEEVSKKEKLEMKVVYSSDESDSSKSYGKSDSDEKRRRSEKGGKEERRRDDAERRNKDRRDRKRDRSKDRHRRDRSRDRHKKSSSSSSSSHRKSSHHHKDSRSRRKEEEEKKKSRSADDHGKEKMKKEYRRSTDRDSNERERDRSTGSRSQGECQRREKEQQKTEQAREERGQKEGEEMDQEEASVVTKEVGPDSAGLDLNELFRTGAVCRIEFAKITDDFYVKFNSTGFRYFEEWEKTKLDCEEEFKEFVDEAENDLSLLSDDESEPDLGFGEENRRTIGNLLRGVGNFPRSLMLDPVTAHFYRWTSPEHFDRFRGKREWRRRTAKESEESIKENIDRGEKRRALHLKLLHKYRRKAMRMGRPRRRQRRAGCWGIKEQNENRGASKKKLYSEGVPSVAESVNSVNMFRDSVVTLPESPEESEEWGESGKRESGGERVGERGSMPLHLPPSPDSDDINNGMTPKQLSVFRKRSGKEMEEVVSGKKRRRRNYSQKYESGDLYKPRPVLNSSRTRGKEREVQLDSPISR